MEDSYTNTVLEAISRALNDGVNDRTAVVITVAAVILIFVLLSLIIRSRSRKKIAESAESSYQQLIRKYNLTIRELDLIDILSETLHKREDKYHLLLRAGTFRSASKKAELTDEQSIRLAELENKLGFAAGKPDSDNDTTSALRGGTPLKLLFGNKETGDASVYSVADSGITIKYSDDRRPLVHGEKINALVPLSDRFRVYRLIADRIKGELFSAPHTAPAETGQTEHRIGLTLTFTEEDEGREKKTVKKAFALRTASGGAVIHLSPPLPPPGTVLNIFLDNDSRQTFGVPAFITKQSEKKQMIAVGFGTAPETDHE